MGEFRDYLSEKGLSFVNEIKKEIKNVEWKNNIGYFNIDDEKYEVEFDEFIDNGNNVADIKFYRILGSRRVLKYTESKEPLTVSLTMKDQVKKYLDKHNPDVFGFLGNLTEKPRLRHYERLLTSLHREYKQYENSFMVDREGDRIFILAKNENVLDSTIVSLQQKLDV
jgi:hypothetical protein